MNLEISDGRLRFYQWDAGQQLVVEDAGGCNEVHFVGRDMNEALVCRIRDEKGKRVADVPNLLLQNSGMITAYLFWHGENGGMTSYAKSFVVQKRSKPESYVYEQTECVNYSSLAERIEHLERSGISDDIIVDRIAQYMSENPILPETIGALPADRLPSAVEEALAQAKDSGLFNGKDGASGPQGEKGEKGDTPIRGMDYWTTSDIAQIKSYVDEAILGGMW